MTSTPGPHRIYIAFKCVSLPPIESYKYKCFLTSNITDTSIFIYYFALDMGLNVHMMSFIRLISFLILFKFVERQFGSLHTYWYPSFPVTLTIDVFYIQ